MASKTNVSGDNRPARITEVNGYIHDVSDVNMAKTGTRYFHFKVQENASEFTRVACFSPEKRKILKDKEQSKDAARLLNLSPQKRKFEPDTKEYIMNKYSRVLDGKSVSFAWKSAEVMTNPVSLCEIVQKGNGNILSVKARVVSISKSECVYSSVMEKELKKCDIVVADGTGAMSVCLWEDLIDQVKEESSYLFTNLKVSFFKTQYLNSTMKSVINVLNEEIVLSKETKDDLELLLKSKESRAVQFNGKILSAEVTKSYICINCKNRVYHENVDDSKVVVKCPSCNLSTLKRNMTTHVTANVIIEDDNGETERFHCSMAVLKSTFSSLCDTDGYNIKVNDLNNLSEDIIAETLLLIENIGFLVNKEEKTVESIEIRA